jgi:pimeloyl-ACP methyl ester carboxylesterase
MIRPGPVNINKPEDAMIEMRRIRTASNLVFDVSVAGTEGRPQVLMLHGFCVSRYFWQNQMPALAAAGYFAVAPNQRGYSMKARPDPGISTAIMSTG